MSKGFFKSPIPINEPIKSYTKGSSEKKDVLTQYKKLYSKTIKVPMYIGSEKVITNDKKPLSPPHDHKHIIGYYYKGDSSHVKKAIDSALKAKKKWKNMDWEHRASIFLKAADLLAGPFRAKINAATMLAQSKNIYQAEIDSACELIDFFRFNVHYMEKIYSEQPESAEGMWNRLEYRPLEGFIFALTPFNFTAIAGNLPAAPALMGNTVVWKPASSQIYSANVIMEVLKEAGLPDGVINMITVDGSTTGKVVFSHPEFSGLHFTGSTKVFQNLWETIGKNIREYKSYPRIVGETGGKDFIIAHPTANKPEVATAISRGAFEFQGQKCSAASRAYIPKSMWPKLKELICQDVDSFKIGSPDNFSNFINAVIDEKSFDKISEYIDYIQSSNNAQIIAGGNYNKEIGYFIDPTIVVTTDPKFKTMCEEIFGPVITIYIYEDNDFEKTLELVNETSEYALTGAIFSQDRLIIEHATQKLNQAAGNFYINDKPTGAVVGQQPFGGGRLSGTNDKAGSIFNLLRWVSPRTIKETFVPPRNYRYPFLEE